MVKRKTGRRPPSRPRIRPSALREHEISIVANAPHQMPPAHDVAIRKERSEADAMGVEAWLTEDHTHVVKIASNRAPDK